jgi:putative ABC transport system substrate-binding protein
MIFISAKIKAISFVAAGLILLSVPTTIRAQQPKEVARRGFLVSGSPSADGAWVEAFRQGLRELGYVEGRSIVIDYRFGKGKTAQFPALVTELVELKAKVIVVGGATATRAAKRSPSGSPLSWRM